MRQFIGCNPPMRIWRTLFILVILLGACSPTQPAPTKMQNLPTLIYYDWEGMIPQNLLDEFYRQTGIVVDYETFASQTEAVASIKNGKHVDVANIETDIIPELTAGNFLAKIDPLKIPNLKFVNSDFLGHAYDPENQYTVPNSWGTTGLIVRSDLLNSVPLTRWGDLWNENFTGKIAFYRDEPVTTIAIALKSLGYSINTDDPLNIRKAEDRLKKIRDRVVFVDNDENAAEVLASGEVVVCVGFAGTAFLAQEKNSNIEYILPEEGSMIWTDNYVVPASSNRLDEAFLFINFLNDPKNNAKLVNTIYYASANEMARSYIEPEILNNPAIYPQPIEFQNAEFFLPHRSDVQALDDEIWENFTNGK